MTLLEWWIEYGDKYGFPYDATIVNPDSWCLTNMEARLEGWTTGGKDDRPYTEAGSAWHNIWWIQDQCLKYKFEGYEIAKNALANLSVITNAEYQEWRHATGRDVPIKDPNVTAGRYVSRSDAKKNISQLCYTALDNIINGKTTLQTASPDFPAFYDVTDLVTPGQRIVVPSEDMLGQSKNGYFIAGNKVTLDIEKYEVTGDYYRVYNKETGMIDYYNYFNQDEYLFSVEPTKSNRRIFFDTVLPGEIPASGVNVIPGHWVQTHEDGNVFFPRHAEHDMREDRNERLLEDDLTSVELVSQLKQAGYIKKYGDKWILCAVYDEDKEEYVTCIDMMKMFNNKTPDPVTGLTPRQEVIMFLSEGTFTSDALAGKEYNKSDCQIAGYIQLQKAGADADRTGVFEGNGRFKWDEDFQQDEDYEKAHEKRYWNVKQAQNDFETLAITESTANLQDKMLTRCCNDVIDKLNKFYESIEAGHVPTRGELLRNEQYRQTILAIQSKLSSEGQQNLTVIKGSMEQIVKTVNISVLTKGMINATVNTEYKGENYSSRVWNNTRTLATRLESTIEDCIIAGRNIQEATTKIEHEFSVARYQAERLLRTETARVYTRATEDSFASAGIDEVKILVERGACEECAKLKGKTWKRGEQPTLPIHPNCRCALAPVVKARYIRKEK